MPQVSLGLDTFGDVSLGPDGTPQPMDRVLREVVEQAVVADGWASTSSGSASITATTLPSRRPRSCSPPSPGARSASGSARR
jgi:hypothetical protein